MSRRPLLIAAAALLLAACTPGTNANQDVAPAGQEAKGSIEFWHFFTDREAKAIDAAIAKFEDAHPDIDVKVTAGQDDAKMLQAISSGKGPDVGLSYSTDIVGKFCSSNAWRDLTPYLERDEVDLEQFPETVRSYTSYQGKRCAMPFLADVYGMYFNKTLLAQAGYTAPPKTMTELADMAKKLTKRAPDGTIEVAGFLPLLNFYEHTPQHTAPAWNARWLTDDERSAIGTDPNWAAMLKWHKDLVDWYGYDNLQKFTAGLGDEWSADNAFHKGKLAMAIDGEYRVAFLHDQAPDLDFGTAPLPVADDQADRYGAGFVTGNVAGISANSEEPGGRVGAGPLPHHRDRLRSSAWRTRSRTCRPRRTRSPRPTWRRTSSSRRSWTSSPTPTPRPRRRTRPGRSTWRWRRSSSTATCPAPRPTCPAASTDLDKRIDQALDLGR